MAAKRETCSPNLGRVGYKNFLDVLTTLQCLVIIIGSILVERNTLQKNQLRNLSRINSNKADCRSGRPAEVLGSS